MLVKRSEFCVKYFILLISTHSKVYQVNVATHICITQIKCELGITFKYIYFRGLLRLHRELAEVIFIFILHGGNNQLINIGHRVTPNKL